MIICRMTSMLPVGGCESLMSYFHLHISGSFSASPTKIEPTQTKYAMDLVNIYDFN